MWKTDTWYSLSVTDDGTNVTFRRGKSPSLLTTVSVVADPTGGAGTAASDGSLFLGGGPGASPFSGSLEDVRLSVPLKIAPSVGAALVSYASAATGTPVTVTAPIAARGRTQMTPTCRRQASTKS